MWNIELSDIDLMGFREDTNGQSGFCFQRLKAMYLMHHLPMLAQFYLTAIVLPFWTLMN